MPKLFPAFKNEDEEFYKDFKDFMDAIYGTVSALKDAIENYCSDNLKDVRKNADRVIHLESEADSIRRNMEKSLYSGVLIPFGREDKYELLEAIDDVADKAEIIVRLSKMMRPKLSKKIKQDLPQLMSIVERSAFKLRKAVLYLNEDIDMAIQEAKDVEIEREKARELEFELLETLFSKKQSADFRTILIKELISLIGEIADKCEEAGDRVVSLAVKYKE